MTLAFTIESSDGAARSGTVRTARGSYRTPCFMPVGTRGAVRTLSAADLDALGVEVVLANTYHLMLRPGVEVVEQLGGLHRFAGWDHQILTDSGGFQVLSLSPAVDEEGVAFRSCYDGSRHYLTPEDAVSLQERLGSDIQMVLDVCPPLPSPPALLRQAVERTAAWAARARRAHRREGQAIFGIVQGGTDDALRRESAQRTVALGFDGYGIGGLSVGEPASERNAVLAATLPELPADHPRYLMGVGDPLGIVDAVGLGVDQFDCVTPTRLARHGTALSAAGRVHVRNAAFAADDRPLDPSCGCPVCARWSRGYVRHLLNVGDPGAARLLTLHNLAWMQQLMEQVRGAIAAGALANLRAALASAWQGG